MASKRTLMEVLGSGGGDSGGGASGKRRGAIQKPPVRVARLAPANWRAVGETVLVHDFMHDDAHADRPMRVAAFDFDGCVAKTDVRNRGPNAWSMMFNNVPDVMRELHARRYRNVILTNESIERFVDDEVRRQAVVKKTSRLDGFMRKVGVPCLSIISFASDEYRKPDTKAWELITTRDGHAPDKAASFYVGDACGREKDHGDSDLMWARNLGITFFNETDFFHSRAYERLDVFITTTGGGGSSEAQAHAGAESEL